jgi:predicted metal-dependent HD superfamily phosphohydrolase
MMPDFVQFCLPTLLALYNGKDRFYHDITHINFCLARVEQFNRDTATGSGSDLSETEWEALLIAVYFHDAIYNAEAQMVQPAWSEHYSSQLMYGLATEYRKTLRTQEEIDELTNVILLADKLIIATAKHGEEHDTFLEKLMCDIDLSSLALPWNQFDKNTDQVIREYALFRDEATIREGNAKFLKKLIDKGTPIFQTGWGAQFEEMAQWNIKHRIALVLPANEQF